MKISFSLLALTFLSLVVIYSCSTDEEDTPDPIVQTPQPEPEPQEETEQFTLTVSAAEGGSVSTEGGTYDEGTEVTITATANEGYRFTGWEGNSSTSESLTVTINSNQAYQALFEIIPVNSYYSKGDIVQINPVIFFDRSLTINGIKIIVAGEIGGQQAVPDQWIYKTARVFELLMDKNGEGIDTTSQLNMIKTLLGEIGWHKNYPTGQRVAYGGGNEYSPSFLTDEGIQYYGLDEVFDSMALDDMVWYKNVDSQFKGDDDITEILEHTLHTLHRFGVRGGVDGSTDALNIEAEEEDISNTEIFLAMKEAYENGVFNIDGYGGNINNRDAWPVILKEYQYLLTFGMWEFSEFWEGGSLSPEWNDNARTPEGILANNPLGYELYNNYFAPVLSKPSKETLRSIFQDNDEGEHGYIPDN